MTEEVRRLLATALPQQEPPLTVHASELVAAGRRRRRRNRIGYTASGATFAVAVVTTLALVLPGLIGGTSDADVRPPGGGDGTTADPPATDPAELSDRLRIAAHEAFDVPFTTASGWNVGDEPFELTETGSQGLPYLVGYAGVEGEGYELVGVELYPPGDWTTEPNTEPGGDRDTDRYLIDCGSGSQADSRITTTCDSRELDDGTLLRTGKMVEESNSMVVGTRYTSVAYRTDGTAIVLRTECHDEGDEIDCGERDFATVDAADVERFLVTAPKVPHEW